MDLAFTGALSRAAVKSGFLAVCILITNASPLPGREYTGVVYSNHSGPSANGTGEIQLSTKTGLVGIPYQKPINLDSSDHRCYEVGAIWTVQTSRSDEFVKAHCAGKLDTDVHSAWMAVRNYIKAAANGVGQELGYQPGRLGVPVKMGELEIDLAGYLDFGSTGMCLEMKEHIGSNSIIIESSADCYFIPDLDFRVERTRQTTWKVTSVKAVPRNR